MEENATYKIEVLPTGTPLPLGADELFGTSASEALNSTKSPAICIAAMTPAGALAAGVLMLIEGSENGAGGVASIRQLVVKPEHRARGLAGRLLRRAMEAARQAGCERVRSTAGWGCGDHLMMYERLGFARSAPGERPYLVEKSLAARSA